MPTRDAYAIASLAVLIFFVAFNLQSGWVYAVDALLAGVLLVGFLSARHAVRGVRVSRTLPSEAVEGEPVTVGLTIAAGGAIRRVFLRVQDAVPGLRPAEVFIPSLSPRRPLRTSYVTTAVRRGTHRAGPTVLSSGGLAGLFVARREVAAPAEITVYPRYWKLSRFPLAAWTPSMQAAGATRRRGGLEFYGLRDYRSGDSLRHVHWRSSARRGALMVREFEQDLPGSLTLLIDTRPQVQAGGGAESTFEDLIRAAASIAWYVTSHGGAVRLLAATADGPLDLTAGWRPVLQALADLRMDGDVPPARLLDMVGAGRMPVVALSPDPGAVAALAASGSQVAGIVADAASYDGGATGSYDNRATGSHDNRATGSRDSRAAGSRDRRAVSAYDNRIIGAYNSQAAGSSDSLTAGSSDSQGAGAAGLDRAGAGVVCVIRRGDDIGLRLEHSAG